MTLMRLRSNYKDRLGRLPPAKWQNSPASLDVNFCGALKLPAYMTHSRAQISSCYDQTGRLVYPPHNLLPYSSAYNSGSWSRGLVDAVVNSVANPVDGSTTAATITAQVSTGAHYIRLANSTMSGIVNVCAYAKAGTHRYVAIRNYSAISCFDLQTGTWITTSGTITQYAEHMSDGWWRIGTDALWTVAAQYEGVSMCDATGNESWTSVGTETFHLYGIQRTLGAGMRPYVNTPGATPQARPSLTYDPATGVATGLQVMGARTNLAQFSEEFDNAYWTKAAQATINPNVYVAPDGALTADQYVATAGGNNAVSRTFTTTTAVGYGSSVFLRYVSGSGWVRLMTYDGTANRVSLWFNLATGATGTSSAGGIYTLKSIYAKKLPGGWWRIGVCGSQSGTTTYWALSCMDGDNSATQAAGTFGIWGGQFESGDMISDYKPTYGAVTIVGASDSEVISGAAAAAIIDNSRGAMMVVADWSSGSDVFVPNRVAMAMTDATLVDRRILYNVTTGRLGSYYSPGGTVSVAGASVAGEMKRLITSYDTAWIGTYVDGSGTTATTAYVQPVCDRLGIGSQPTAGGIGLFFGTVAQALVFKAPLDAVVMAILSNKSKVSSRTLRWRNYKTKTTRKLRRAMQPCSPVG
jgi:hypothetical protein